MTGHDMHSLVREETAQPRAYSVAAPQRCEGISSALRVAFDTPARERLADDIERLLDRLN